MYYSSNDLLLLELDDDGYDDDDLYDVPRRQEDERGRTLEYNKTRVHRNTNKKRREVALIEVYVVCGSVLVVEC